MTVPGSLIVPDPKPPPVFLLGAGALLLAGLVIRTLRRQRRRASTRGDTGLGFWRTAVPHNSAPMDVPVEVLRALPAPAPRIRFEEGAQKRGRAVKKRP